MLQHHAGNDCICLDDRVTDNGIPDDDFGPMLANGPTIAFSISAVLSTNDGGMITEPAAAPETAGCA